MPTYVLLLRAVNVGGTRKLPMADLRSMLGELGHADVATYIQSGNAVFRSTGRSAEKIARAIEAAIESRFGFDSPAAVIPAAEFSAIVAGNPFPAEAAATPKFIYATLFAKAPSAKDIAAFVPPSGCVDPFVLRHNVFYSNLANGCSKTKLTQDYLERRLCVPCTARNWNTMLALQELAAGLSS